MGGSPPLVGLVGIPHHPPPTHTLSTTDALSTWQVGLLLALGLRHRCEHSGGAVLSVGGGVFMAGGVGGGPSSPAELPRAVLINQGLVVPLQLLHVGQLFLLGVQIKLVELLDPGQHA